MDHQGHPFLAVIAVAERQGVKSICDMPGCWEFDAGKWWVAVNGHKEAVKCSRGAEVPAFHAYVEFNGWPAGLLHPHGEGWLAAGAAANTETFVAAMDALS
jgi:hypothetical protein